LDLDEISKVSLYDALGSKHTADNPKRRLSRKTKNQTEDQKP